MYWHSGQRGKDEHMRMKRLATVACAALAVTAFAACGDDDDDDAPTDTEVDGGDVTTPAADTEPMTTTS